jgi:hypothetical protein
MDEIQQSQIGRLGPESPDSGEIIRKVSRLLLLWPLAGVIVLLVVMITYQPLDEMLIYWVGAAPCVIAALLINVAWRMEQGGRNVRSFFPRTVWFAVGCLLVPMALLANGVLDRSPVESHGQTVTRTILEHGRHGSISYYLELTSWRASRTHEKVMVPKQWYLEANPGDPVIVETHKGALGIPLLVSVHRPD